MGMDMLSVAYKLIGIDPWDIHSIVKNAERTTASIQQITRFGIGDIYFLSAAYGLMELVVGEVDHCSHRTLHLTNGRKLATDVVLKCTGFLGDWEVDRLLRLKELTGFWVNGDPRRAIVADPNGISAASFSATTTGPGTLAWCGMIKHFWDHPSDWLNLEAGGHLQMLATHKPGTPTEDTPGYMVGAYHASSTMIILTSASPLLGEKHQAFDVYKNYITHLCHPAEKMLKEAKAEWDTYERDFRDRGQVPIDSPYIPYPYDLEWIEKQYKIHSQVMQKVAKRSEALAKSNQH